MKRRDLAVVAMAAAVTFVAAIGFWRASPDAIADAENAEAPKPVSAVLQLGDVEVTVSLKKAKYEADESPEFVVTAVNRGSEAVVVPIAVKMMAAPAPADAMSRMGPRMRELQSSTLEFSLGAGESESREVQQKVAAGAAVDRVGTVFVSSGDKSVALSVPGGAAQAAEKPILPGPNTVIQIQPDSVELENGKGA